MAAGAFDDAGGDGPPVCECGGVVEVGAFAELSAQLSTLARSWGPRRRQVALRRIDAATVLAWPLSTARALSWTQGFGRGVAFVVEAPGGSPDRTLTGQSRCAR